MSLNLFSNPKYIRQQIKKVAKLIKERKAESRQSLHKTAELKLENLMKDHGKTITAIKEINSKEFSFNNLNKLFNDSYFEGQIILSPTKNGLIIIAHHRRKK